MVPGFGFPHTYIHALNRKVVNDIIAENKGFKSGLTVLVNGAANGLDVKECMSAISFTMKITSKLCLDHKALEVEEAISMSNGIWNWLRSVPEDLRSR